MNHVERELVDFSRVGRSLQSDKSLRRSEGFCGRHQNLLADSFYISGRNIIIRSEHPLIGDSFDDREKYYITSLFNDQVLMKKKSIMIV